MLWLACRHHILELVLESVVSISFLASSGPDIQLFKRFRAKWMEIDQTNYQTAASDPSITEKISCVGELIEFAKNPNY